MKLLGRGTALWNLNQKFIGDMLKILSFLFENVHTLKTLSSILIVNILISKFTSMIEIDNSLSFLDIEINRAGSHIVISLYRKPTFSLVFTNRKTLDQNLLNLL